MEDRALLEVSLPEIAIPGFGSPTTQPFKKGYRFRQNYFPQNILVWEKVLAEFKGKPDVHYLEIGLFEGQSAFWVLENILTHPTSRLTGMDPFIDTEESSDHKGFKAVFFENLKLSGAEERFNVIIGFSQVELRKLPLDSFDIIYIDGSHVAVDVLEDAVLSHRLLKRGGVLIFDDYLWGMEGPATDRPRPGIHSFYAHYKDQYEVLHHEYQLILRKKPANPVAP